jgi:hypothetical protein
MEHPRIFCVVMWESKCYTVFIELSSTLYSYAIEIRQYSAPSLVLAESICSYLLWYLDLTVRRASSVMGRETVSTRRSALYSLAR